MFTPVETTIGALLLHQATSNLLYQNGNILGASGFLRQLLSAPTKELLAFFTGMAASSIPLKALAPQSMTSYPEMEMTLQSVISTAAISALIGWGTKVSNGCTSGHMLCGLSRLSGRSASAVAVFFPTAIITHHFAHPNLSTPTCPSDVPCYMPVYPRSEVVLSLVILAALSVFAARNIPSLVALVTTSDNGKEDAAEARIVPRSTTQFFSGLLFALGLHISQMANPDKVAAFLSFPTLQHWDPSLALVILFGVVPNLMENQAKGFADPPRFAEKFALPIKTVKDMEKRFIVGAAAFGIGWGLTGTCPGPAVLRALSQPVWGLLWIGGFWLGGKVSI